MQNLERLRLADENYFRELVTIRCTITRHELSLRRIMTHFRELDLRAVTFGLVGLDGVSVFGVERAASGYQFGEEFLLNHAESQQYWKEFVDYHLDALDARSMEQLFDDPYYYPGFRSLRMLSGIALARTYPECEIGVSRLAVLPDGTLLLCKDLKRFSCGHANDPVSTLQCRAKVYLDSYASALGQLQCGACPLNSYCLFCPMHVLERSHYGWYKSGQAPCPAVAQRLRAHLIIYIELCRRGLLPKLLSLESPGHFKV